MEFERPKGFTGSAPRNWIDKNLARCPLCKTPSLWEIGFDINPKESDRSFFKRFSRYYFRCSNCLSVLSVDSPMIDMPFSSVPLTNAWLFRKAADKTLKIESVGNNVNLSHLVGAKYPLDTLQAWAREV
ncbi:MAG: hypothetical protein NWF00_05260 [Candidatus Bathyarchaeota archaeon]|nr:hypothetical protein [Candidatus Bathyarchaeota archaeon]